MIALQELLQSLGQCDADYAARSDAAKQNGKVLRYVASIDTEKKTCLVGLEAVLKTSALGPLDLVSLLHPDIATTAIVLSSSSCVLNRRAAFRSTQRHAEPGGVQH